MNKFYVEKYNASDDTFKINEINCSNGELVKKSTLLFSIESSKSNIDIDSTLDGFVYFNIEVGQNINIGDLFYIISQEKLPNWESIFSEQPKKINSNLTISKKAEQLLVLNNIDPILLNKTIIKENDVIEYIYKLNESSEFDEKGRNLILNNNNKTPLIIIGAKGGAKMCIDALRQSDKYAVVGLLDDNIKVGQIILGIPVIGNLNDIENIFSLGYTNYIIAFGVLENRIKRFELYNKLKKIGCEFPNIIHPNALIEESVTFGEGNVILAGANIGSCVTIGNLNYINNNSLISHDCVLENNIHIAPAAVLASSIQIKSNTLIGMNTTLYFGIKIGSNSTILNGLIVNNDVEDNIILKSNN